MDASHLLGSIAAILALLALAPYVYSIIRGTTRPNRASWLIWSMVTGSLSASYYYSGATTTFWITVSAAITALVVFLLSFKYGVGGYTVLDIVCLIGAVIGLGLWWYTSNPATALYLNIFVDALGFLPTIKKAYLSPKSEPKLAWNIMAFANILNVAALTTWQLQVALFPVYNLVMNVAVASLLFGTVQKRRTAHRPKQS